MQEINNKKIVLPFFKPTLISLAALFAGFAIGRVSHVYGGDLPVPHHWIYGPILAAAGSYYRKTKRGIYLIYLGIGLFISDLRDFSHGLFWGGTEPAIKRFWGID